jgi:hypothetical protein
MDDPKDVEKIKKALEQEVEEMLTLSKEDIEQGGINLKKEMELALDYFARHKDTFFFEKDDMYVKSRALCLLEMQVYLKGISLDERPLAGAYTHRNYLRMLNKTKVFKIDEKIVIPLLNTENKISLRKLPFTNVFIDAHISLPEVEILGINIVRCKTSDDNEETVTFLRDAKDEEEREEEEEADDILITFVGLDKRDGGNFYSYFPLCKDAVKGHVRPELEFLDPIIKNFVVNFLDLLDAKDVEVVQRNITREHNLKRVKRGKMPMPLISYIVRITGETKIYLDKMESSGTREFSHKFWVRGHWRTLRSPFWKNKQGMKIWIIPHIKGQGILIEKKYVVDKSIKKEVN